MTHDADQSKLRRSVNRRSSTSSQDLISLKTPLVLAWVSSLILTLIVCPADAQTPSGEHLSRSHETSRSSLNLERGPLREHEVFGADGAVSSDNATASEVGVAMLRAGGDAADAAVATALMLGVVQPFASGIGGGGFAVVYRVASPEALHRARVAQKPRAYTLDFREVAPSKATASMYLDEQGSPVEDLSTVGALAAAVPGEVAGLYELHMRHGKLPWHKVVGPALRAARDGFEMHPLLHERAQGHLDRVKRSETLSRALLTAQGEVKPLKALVRFPDLARTLEAIAERGASGFYRGAVAQEIARSVQAAGGIITRADLRTYQPKERAVLTGEYQGYTLLTMPPPSSGGAVIIQALRTLEEILDPQTPHTLGRHSSLYLHALTESLKHAFADRARYMGDPDFVAVPLAEMLSSTRITSIVKHFNADQTRKRGVYGGNYLSPPDGGTSHFNVIDRQGNAIALTTTINTGFGSRFVAGASGVLLNNEMDDFIVKPGVPNAYGLIGRKANAVEPGKRPLSSMSPTIILNNRAVVGMVGGSGGPTIITGTLQVLLNLIHFDGVNGDVGRAVVAPRVHHQWVPETLMYDRGLPRSALDGLLARGHELRPWYARFNAIQTLWIKRRDHQQLIFGASDPSKRGRPAVVRALSLDKN